MPQSELSVAITGTDSLSPALQRVNQNLERARAALTASGAVADTYAAKLAKVQAAYALGEIDAIKYERSLRRLERDFQSTAATVERYAASTGTATTATNTLATAQMHTTRGATRLVFGVQTLSAALDGGRVSAQGLVSGLTALGIGSGPFLIITAGLSVIAGLLLSIEDAGTRAEKATAGVLQRARGMGVAGTEQRIADLRAQEADFRDATITGRHARERARLEREALESVLPILRNDPLRGQSGTRATGGTASRGHPFAGADSVPSELRSLPSVGTGADILRRHGLGGTGETFGGNDVSNSLATLYKDAFRLAPVMEGVAKSVQEIGKSVRDTTPAITMFSDAFSVGFGAVIDAAASGGNVFQAFTSNILAALAREAKGKAVFEAAEGFAALGRGLLFHDPKALAAAGAHFQAAALYGGAAVASSALAGGAGGGAGGTSSYGSQAPGVGTGSRGPVTIIQFVTPDGRELARSVVESNARQERLGAPMLVRQPLNAIVAAGPIQRA